MSNFRQNNGQYYGCLNFYNANEGQYYGGPNGGYPHPYAMQPVAPFNTDAMAFLICGTLFFPILGIIVGALNLKHVERKTQSVILLIEGGILAVLDYLLLSCAMVS